MSEEESKTSQDEALADDWEAALNEQASSEEGAADDPDALLQEAEANTETQVESAEFQQLMPEKGSQGDVNLDAILDVPVTVSMEIGRTRLQIRNLLQLNQGSVVELDRLAGEPMDVLVNGTLIAQGEVVVVNEKFGIRLTDIISPSDRIKRLG
ncbi:MAG TPA: flagellar motor switch protein FliN [Chromatiales bacterium]|nr:flagellar motor switch protein FliN [Chromatiales bacterium]